MKIFAVLGILLIFIAAVTWIERGAYAKIEAQRLSEAVKFQRSNTLRVQGKVEELTIVSNQREDELNRKIEMLEALNVLPPVVQTEEEISTCPSSCQLRWE